MDKKSMILAFVNGSAAGVKAYQEKSSSYTKKVDEKLLELVKAALEAKFKSSGSPILFRTLDLAVALDVDEISKSAKSTGKENLIKKAKDSDDELLAAWLSYDDSKKSDARDKVKACVDFLSCNLDNAVDGKFIKSPKNYMKDFVVMWKDAAAYNADNEENKAMYKELPARTKRGTGVQALKKNLKDAEKSGDTAKIEEIEKALEAVKAAKQ